MTDQYATFFLQCQLQWIFNTDTTGAMQGNAKRKWQISHWCMHKRS